MNFEPMSLGTDGHYHMKYTRPFTIPERMQLLERSILVNSFAYYELDENILADHQYDANSKQLVQLYNEHPDMRKRSRYYQYFHDFTGETGFHLIGRVRDKDPELYRFVWRDAVVALDNKRRYMKEEN